MDSTENYWNTDFLVDILFETSTLALAEQSSLEIFSKRNINNEYETYTHVDLEVEKKISAAFTGAYPNISIIGEEGVSAYTAEDIIRALHNEAIIIDPIDGTNNYINALPNWAISIGRVQNFEFIDGAIVLPIFGELLLSVNNRVYVAKEKRQVSEIESFELSEYSLGALATTQHMCYSASSKIPGNSHKVHVDRSCVYGVFKVLTHSYFGYIGKANLWDYAACIGLFRNIGLPVYYLDRAKREITQLPWKISEEHWIGHTHSRYPLIFTDTLEHAHEIAAI